MALDLSYLEHRERVERKRAQWGGCHASRAVHRGLADEYAQRIRALAGSGSGDEPA